MPEFHSEQICKSQRHDAHPKCSRQDAKSAKSVIFASFAPLREIFALQHVIAPYTL
jgi:hypothetical protein